MMKNSWISSLFWLLGLIALCGCQPSVATSVTREKRVLTERDRLILGQEPSGVVGILELRESMTTSESGDSEVVSEPVVLVGRIGGKATKADRLQSDFPWDKGKAAFIMSDPTASIELDHDHGDEEHDCPFCNRKAADAQALVQFVGDDGNPVPIDARDLFELEGEELVVIQGKAELVGTLLMVTADGIYVRR